MPLQVQLQQGYSPHGVWVAKILRAAGEEFLEEQGWCRIHYTGQVTPPQCSFKSITREQVHTARALLYTDADPDWQDALRRYLEERKSH